MPAVTPNWLDRLALAVSPRWGAARLRNRAVALTLARHYDAAALGRRTENWHRASTDGNTALAPSLPAMRALSRDLLRNNGWARNAKRTVVDNTVGWGITAKGEGVPGDGPLAKAWKRWATKQCDADGRLSLYGLQGLVMGTVFDSGEALVRRRWRRPGDGFALPLQLQVLEPDYLDTSRDGTTTTGEIIQGVEFDKLGRRVAYWLFDQHPGSASLRSVQSRRIAATEILHICPVERPGQVRGAPWLSAAIVNLKDFDEYEDADLVRAKIAACFAGFVTDVNGAGEAIGEQSATDDLVETLEPGLISKLPPGTEIEFATPPITQDNGFSVRTLRRIAAAIGITYEDMTGDYSQVNFSSARMARLKHWGHVHSWRWNMLVPQFCDGVWGWAMEAAAMAGLVEGSAPDAEWTPPPMPMLEPDREGLALKRLVRTGAMTPDEMVRERGYDPETHWPEFAENLKRLDELKIVLDCDPRRVSDAGLTQERAGVKSDAPPADAE
jgi:lambda family phage portal protein